MKWLLVVVAVAGFITAVPLNASASSAAPIAAYSFDEGEGETLKTSPATATKARSKAPPGPTRAATARRLDFDGEGDCVSTPNTPALQLTEEFTLEAWVRPNSTSPATQ